MNDIIHYILVGKQKMNCKLGYLSVMLFPNLDKPEPKFCQNAQDVVVKCLI